MFSACENVFNLLKTGLLQGATGSWQDTGKPRNSLSNASKLVTVFLSSQFCTKVFFSCFDIIKIPSTSTIEQFGKHRKNIGSNQVFFRWIFIFVMAPSGI